MSSDFLTDFLASILKEQGVQNPVQVAEKAAEDLRKSRIVDQKHIRTVELHRKIDQLRGLGYERREIADRVGRTPETVDRIVREQLQIRKANTAA